MHIIIVVEIRNWLWKSSAMTLHMVIWLKLKTFFFHAKRPILCIFRSNSVIAFIWIYDRNDKTSIFIILCSKYVLFRNSYIFNSIVMRINFWYIIILVRPLLFCFVIYNRCYKYCSIYFFPYSSLLTVFNYNFLDWLQA